MGKAKFHISELFEVVSGKTTNLYSLSHGSTPFVAATEKNNGISAYIEDAPTFKENLITVSRNGSVCEAFFQPLPFCASLDDIRVLIPKDFTLDVYTGLYICTLIRREKFRYNYGRKYGTSRIRETVISLPTKGKKEVDWDFIRKISKDYLQKSSQAIIDIFSGNYSNESILKDNISLDTEKWKYYLLSDLFIIKKGKRLTKEDMDEGNTPFVGAIIYNNGWSGSIGQPPPFNGNCITINYDGNGVAEAFYQPLPFWALDSVNVLYPKFSLNKYIGFFICAIIKKEKYRFNYGRKWNVERMMKSKIKLPTRDGNPDFDFMENYIKTLPFSASLENKEGKNKPHVKKIEKKTGLSDDELIKKYEGGKVPMRKILKALLTTPPPAETEPSKNKKR